jgi:tRNA threonylcarbamoyladenosine biosynthesis protein TsaE
VKISCNSEDETIAIARRFAATLKQGSVVALSGELGAGKSFFSRAVMRALGVTDKALPSPTFAIIQEYSGSDCRVAHMDWYRLEDADEIEMLGVRDYFQPPWITLIEWPERARGALPDAVIWVSFSTTGVDSREVDFGGFSFA